MKGVLEGVYGMKITIEKYREARKKYLQSLSPEEREQIEEKKRKAEVEGRRKWEELKEELKPLQKLYEDNLHHIRARDILKDAIQAAISNPAMTPEVKETANFFILLLEETGNSFKYDPDAVIDLVVQIARVEIPTKGGTARAENDKKTDCLKKIEGEAIARAKQFRRYGYQTEFAKEMLEKYPILEDDEAIKKRLRKLAREGSIESWRQR